MENKTITLIGLAHESYKLLRKAEDAVRDSLVFTGFGDGEQPTVGICPDGSFLAEWNGKELLESEIISIVKGKGFIEPSDFS